MKVLPLPLAINAVFVLWNLSTIQGYWITDKILRKDMEKHIENSSSKIDESLSAFEKTSKAERKGERFGGRHFIFIILINA